MQSQMINARKIAFSATTKVRPHSPPMHSSSDRCPTSEFRSNTGNPEITIE